MPKNNHIIQKQVLEVEMENPPDAFQFRVRLGEVVHEKILPQMEVLFDEMARQGQIFRIEKLEIDAGVLAAKNWEEELTRNTIAKLKQSLLLQSPLLKVAGIEQQKAIAEIVTVDNFKARTGARTEKQLSDDEFADLLMHYLQHGMLPWYAPLHTRLQGHFRQWLQTHPTPFFKTFLSSATSHQLSRLIYFAGEEHLDDICRLLFTSEQSGAVFTSFIRVKKQLLEVLAKLPSLNKATALKAIYLPVLKWLTSQRQPNDFYQYYAQQSALLFKSFFTAKELLILRDHPQAPPNFLLAKIYEQLIINVEGPQKPLDESQTNEEREPKIEPLADKLFVSDAGLVILHPFLPALFNELKLTVENKFVNDMAHMRAVALTQYLVDGLNEYEDHALLLNKILCGFPLAQPVISNIQFTTQEMDEANDLLQQVTQLWRKNGVQVNGTIDGLRQSFLQRQGKLTTKNNDWQLQVEQKPYDLVLASLPWTIGIVKTPWMKGMLWVEWT